MAKKAKVDATKASEGMDTMLTTADFARLAGLKPDTIRVFRKRGVIPAPDGYLERTPYWFAATVENWIANRKAGGRPRRLEADE